MINTLSAATDGLLGPTLQRAVRGLLFNAAVGAVTISPISITFVDALDSLTFSHEPYEISYLIEARYITYQADAEALTFASPIDFITYSRDMQPITFSAKEIAGITYGTEQ